MDAAGGEPAGRSPSTGRILPFLGLAAAAWAFLPPYSGPALNTETRVEVVDHVVPSVLLVIVSLVTLASRGRKPAGMLPLLCGFGVLLAGVWMTATHVPLVAQATRDEVTAGAAAYHTAPGLVVAALGLVWVVTHWSDIDEEPEP